MKGRTIAIAGAAALALLVAAALFLLCSLDAIVARAIEHYGSAAVGTRVDVEGVEIDLRAATGRLQGLRVANPEGYESDSAFALREIEIGLDAASLRAEPIVVTRLRVNEPVVTLELDAKGRSNLDRLREGMKADAPEKAPEEPAAGGAPTKLAIRELVFEKGTIHASAAGVAERRAVLPSFTLRDLGGSEGASGAEIAQQIATELTRRALVAAAKSRFGDELREEIDEQLGGEAGEAAKGMLDKVLR